MIFNNKKETDFSIQFLNFNLKFDDILILFFLYSLYTEHEENNPIFIILLLLLLG